MNNADDILFNQAPKRVRKLREHITLNDLRGELISFAFNGKSGTYRFTDGSFADASVVDGELMIGQRRAPLFPRR